MFLGHLLPKFEDLVPTSLEVLEQFKVFKPVGNVSL